MPIAGCTTNWGLIDQALRRGRTLESLLIRIKCLHEPVYEPYVQVLLRGMGRQRLPYSMFVPGEAGKPVHLKRWKVTDREGRQSEWQGAVMDQRWG